MDGVGRPAPRRCARHAGGGRLVVDRHLDRDRHRLRCLVHAVARRVPRGTRACCRPGWPWSSARSSSCRRSSGEQRPDVTPLGSVPSTSSFPSGHVAAGVVLYGGLVVIAASITGSKAVARGAAILAAVVVAYVASARVYEGVHHPTDVIGGAVLGMGALFVAAVEHRAGRADTSSDRRSATGQSSTAGGDELVIVAGVVIGRRRRCRRGGHGGRVAVVAQRPDRPAPRAANRPALPPRAPARARVSPAAIIRSRRRRPPRRSGLAAAVVVIGTATAGAILLMIKTRSGFARADTPFAEWAAEHATEASTDVMRAISRARRHEVRRGRRRSPSPSSSCCAIAVGPSRRSSR